NGVVGKLHWQISHCRIEVGKPFVVCAKDNCAKPSVGCHGTPRSLNAPYRRTGAGGTSCPPVRGMSDERPATTRCSATLCLRICTRRSSADDATYTDSTKSGHGITTGCLGWPAGATCAVWRGSG